MKFRVETHQNVHQNSIKYPPLYVRGCDVIVTSLTTIKNILFNISLIPWENKYTRLAFRYGLFVSVSIAKIIK